MEQVAISSRPHSSCWQWSIFAADADDRQSEKGNPEYQLVARVVESKIEANARIQ